MFSASGPNSDGVVTELLLQRLVNRNRMPTPKGYRTQAFVRFASGSLAFPVKVEAGVYACAVRFVREATGQEAALLETGVVEVG